MKTALTALAALTAAAAIAGPAAAQPWRHGDYEGYEQYRYRPADPIDQRQARIDRSIRIGIARHQLTRGELARIDSENRRIAWLEAKFRRHGLNAAEREELNQRLGHLEVLVRMERYDRDYGYRHDRDHRYGYGYYR